MQDTFPKAIEAILESMDTHGTRKGMLSIPVKFIIRDRYTHSIVQQGAHVARMQVYKDTLNAVDKCAKQYHISIDEARLVLMRVEMLLRFQLQAPMNEIEMTLSGTSTWEDQTN